MWLKKKGMGSMAGPVKSDTLLPNARCRSDISSELCVAQALSAEMRPATHYMLRHDTASVMKIVGIEDKFSESLRFCNVRPQAYSRLF